MRNPFMALAEFVVGARVRLRAGERLLTHEAARLQANGRWSRVGRIVLTNQRLLFMPIRVGVIERLRRPTEWSRDWPISRIDSATSVDIPGAPRLMNGSTMELRLRDGSTTSLKVTHAPAFQRRLTATLHDEGQREPGVSALQGEQPEGKRDDEFLGS